MKNILPALGLLSLLSACSDLPTADKEASKSKADAKLSASGDPSALADAAFRNPNRANLQFTYDMMVYADKIEFTDSTHGSCIATGNVWLKCSHPIEGLKEVFGDRAQINVFAQNLRMEGHPRAVMAANDSAKRKEITASSGSTTFEIDRGEGGAFFKVNGPSRTDLISLNTSKPEEPARVH